MAIEHRPPAPFNPGELEPVYMLIGPIQGAPNWQEVAGKRIQSIVPGRHHHIANPRRETLDKDFDYDEQVGWEKRSIWSASRCGSLIVWFAARDYSLPYKEGRGYAKTSLKELERITGFLHYNSLVQVSIGIEAAFLDDPNNDTKYLLHTVREFPHTVHDTLEATVDHALKVRRAPDGDI